MANLGVSASRAFQKALTPVLLLHRSYEMDGAGSSTSLTTAHWEEGVGG